MKHVTYWLWAACCTTALAGAAHADASPSDMPQVFAPGVVSGPANEDSAAIMVSHRVNGVWSTPTVAAFSGQWLDHDPAMAPDGSFLIFSSNRPDHEGGKALDAVMANGKVRPGSGGHLWRVDRKGDGWGQPV